MDETVLVTGCSTGIGRATATAFADRGAAVYATARNPADIQTLADIGCTVDALDVTDQDQVETIVDRAVEETGGVDVLVNNAGYAQQGPIEDIPVERVEAQFDVNVYGPHRLVRAVLPHMRASGNGRIVNVSSVAGRVAVPGMGVYAGSKAALESMTDALRAEVNDHGVEVVLVEPGPVETAFTDRAATERAALDRTDDYEPIYRIYDDVDTIDGMGVDPEAVADVIVEAACTPRPATRYPVGPVSRAGLLARYLPDRLRDRAFDVVERLAGLR